MDCGPGYGQLDVGTALTDAGPHKNFTNYLKSQPQVANDSSSP